MNIGDVNFTQFLLCEKSGPGHVWDPYGLFTDADIDGQIRCSSCGIGADDLRGLRAWIRNMINEARAIELRRANRTLRISAPRFRLDAEAGVPRVDVFQPIKASRPPV